MPRIQLLLQFIFCLAISLIGIKKAYSAPALSAGLVSSDFRIPSRHPLKGLPDATRAELQSQLEGFLKLGEITSSLWAPQNEALSCFQVTSLKAPSGYVGPL